MDRARTRHHLAGVLFVAVSLIAAACTAAQSDDSGALIVPVPRPEAPARTTGFDTTTFRVGVIADLSGPDAPQHRSLLAGVEAYWSSVNALGGVDGHFPVELVVRDVGQSASAAVTAYTDLEPDVVAFALVAGTPVIDAVRELASSDQVVMVPGTRQSTWAGVPSLLASGSSYAAESFNGVAWLSRDDVDPVAWCVVTDGSPIGSDLLVGVLLAEQALDVVGSPQIVDAAAPATEVVNELVSSGCARVWLATDAPDATEIVDAMAAAEVDVTVGVGGEVVLPFTAATQRWASERLIVATDAPSWGGSAAGAAQLRAAMDAHLPDARPDPWIRTGFASQYAVDVVLRSGTLGKDVTRGSLWATAAALADVNAGGLTAAFDRSAGAGGAPRSVTIFEIDGFRHVKIGFHLLLIAP